MQPFNATLQRSPSMQPFNATLQGNSEVCEHFFCLSENPFKIYSNTFYKLNFMPIIKGWEKCLGKQWHSTQLCCVQVKRLWSLLRSCELNIGRLRQNSKIKPRLLTITNLCFARFALRRTARHTTTKSLRWMREMWFGLLCWIGPTRTEARRQIPIGRFWAQFTSMVDWTIRARVREDGALKWHCHWKVFFFFEKKRSKKRTFDSYIYINIDFSNWFF